MKIWYCATSSFDDKDRVTASVTATLAAESKPESTFADTTRKDIYFDWFGSLKEAQDFVKKAKEA